MMNILDNGIHLAQIMSAKEVDKDGNFIILDGNSPFDVIRNWAGVLASIRKGEYLFKQKPVEYDIKLNLNS